MITPKWATVGIDPAPSKDTVACIGGDTFETIRAAHVPDFVAALVRDNARLVLAWDAPLSFDATNGYSDRPADRETRAWVKHQVQAGRIALGAVSVLPFAGCPHWAITCAALGLPFGATDAPLLLATTAQDGAQLVVEVHPAVTLARWWVAQPRTQPLPKYKGLRKDAAAAAIRAIRTELTNEVVIPEAAAISDDRLDAWIAWKMAMDFSTGDAVWTGSPQAGGYVVPPLAASDQPRKPVGS
ncbi:MAG: DUF429 domain-containing protein [Myxococcales bacterium]|nr:DUF429 domain-containing protein [Myxococcales bacterium]